MKSFDELARDMCAIVTRSGKASSCKSCVLARSDKCDIGKLLSYICGEGGSVKNGLNTVGGKQ